MSLSSLQYHMAFATKQRRPLLDPEIMPRLANYIGGTIRGLGGTLLNANGPEDHIHIASILPPTVAVADAMRDIKAGSSGWLRSEIPGMKGFAWQDGYAAFSVSQSVMPKVLEYTRGQQEHHKKMTFMEELAELCKRHGVGFDPKYL